MRSEKLSFALPENLPHGWEITTLEKVSSVVAGNPAPQGAGFFEDGQYPFVRVKDMGQLGGQKNIVKTNDYINDRAIDKLKLFPKGSILFSKSGASTLLNQRAVLGVDAYVVSHIAAILPKDGVLSDWIFYWMKTVDFAYIAHATNMPSLPLSKAKVIKIPIAPLVQQKSIVAEIEKQFSRLDEAVANLKRVKTNLKRYKAAVLKSAVEGKLTEEWRKHHPDVEPAGKLLERILEGRRANWEGRGKYKVPVVPDTSGLSELPRGWVWCSPAQLSSGERYSLAIGPFGSNLKVIDYKKFGVPLVFVRNIRATYFGEEGAVYVSEDKANELVAHQISGGDLLITKMGAPPGDVCLYPENCPDAVITADCIKLRLSPSLPNKLFFLRLIESKVVQSQILGVTKGVAQLKVSLARFSPIGLPLPSLAEQHQIITEVESRFSILAGTEAQVAANLRRADRLRQAILKKAFSGKLLANDETGVEQRILS